MDCSGTSVPLVAIMDSSGDFQNRLQNPRVSQVAMSGSYNDLLNKPTFSTVAISGSYTDLLNTPFIPDPQINSDWSSSSGVSKIMNKPSLATVATTGSYSDLSNRPSIPSAQVNTDWNSSSGMSQLLNKPTFASVALSGSYSDLSNKPAIPSAQIQSDWIQANTGSLDYIKNKPAALSQSAVTRSLNSAFQVSATRLSEVRYSVDISTTVSLTGGAVGRVILEMATNSAFTTGVQELQSFGNGNTGTIVVGLVLTQLSTACLSGKVPAGNYVRLRTVNVTGSPTYTYQSGQEILM